MRHGAHTFSGATENMTTISERSAVSLGHKFCCFAGTLGGAVWGLTKSTRSECKRHGAARRRARKGSDKDGNAD